MKGGPHANQKKYGARLEMFSLSAAQHSAVHASIDRPLLITATPGSGKTAVLISRVLEIQKQTDFRSKIFCISFTNAASRELQKRLTDPRGVWCGTIHKLALLSLSTRKKVGTARQLFEAFEVALKRETGQTDHQDEDEDEFAVEASEKSSAKLFLHLSRYRSDRNCSDALNGLDQVDEFLVQLSRSFDEELHKRDLCDLPTLLTEAIDNLEQTPTDQSAIYLLVDEAQDCDALQWEFLLKFIRKSPQRLSVVGDDNQRIFLWKRQAGQTRTSLAHHMAVGNCQIVSLDQNYRCDRRIVTIGNLFSKIPCVSVTGSEGQVLPRIFKCRREQLEFMAGEIRKFQKFPDVAILARLNCTVANIAAFLKTQKIPTSTGKVRALAKTEKIQNYFRLLRDPANVAAFFYCLKNPRRGLGLKAEETMRRSLDEADSTRPAKNLISSLGTLAADLSNARDRKALQTFGTFWKDEISDLAREADDKKAVQKLAMKLGEGKVDGGQMADILRDERNQNGGGVQVMTIHAAKGREWPCVFIDTEMLPFHRADVEDERRVMYVAVTRAKHRLYICGYSPPGGSISVFLEEILSRA